MLTGKILNSQASLNNFSVVGNVDFMLGDSFKMVFRIIDPQIKDRFVPPNTAIVTLTFQNLDGTDFQKVATVVDPLDNSILSLTFSTTETAQLVGGNVTFSIDLLGDQSQIVNGILYNALHRIVLDCSC